MADGKRRIVYREVGLRSPNHFVFKISLKDGKTYALDLTAAEYGRYSTVTPWEVYKKDMIVDVIECRSCGWSLEEKKKEAKNLETLELNGQKLQDHEIEALWLEKKGVALNKNRILETLVRLRVRAQLHCTVAYLLEGLMCAWVENKKESIAEIVNGKAEVFAKRSEEFQLRFGQMVEDFAKGFRGAR